MAIVSLLQVRRNPISHFKRMESDIEACKKPTTAAMYLASLKNGPTITYQIRQSYRLTDEDSLWSFRIIFDFGNNPRSFFKVVDDCIVLFDDNLLEAVSAADEKESCSLLEQLLWRFLPQETRKRLALFGTRSALQPAPFTDRERENIARQIHLFDRRRLYYLRYGAVDQSRLSRLHEKCCRPFLDTCRDEREYLFAAEEAVLSPGVYLQYVYAIFNIQKHFHQSFAAWFPEALAFDEVADHFLSEICELNQDLRFWQGEVPDQTLHSHLHRYLIMFFDFSPAGRSFHDDFARAFMAGHRRFRWPERTPSHPPEKMSKVFTTPYEELKKMTGEQLNRLYRKKAMLLHPDRGGDHDLFIELTEVYESLRRMKK